MRLVTTALWHQDRAWPNLTQSADLTPSAWIPQREVRANTLVHLLWTPPYSEANGWDSQPSEIPLSEIVTGFLKPIDTAAGSNDRLIKCDIQIDSRVPLLDFLRSRLGEPSTDVSSMPSKGASVIWQNLRWSGHARVGDFLYVAATSGEAELEFIARGDGGGYVIHFEHYVIDGWRDCALGSWRLDGSMLQAFEKRLEGGVELDDLARPSLDSVG